MRAAGLPEPWTFGEIYGFDEDLLSFVPQPCLAVIINAEFLKKQEDRQRGDPAVANDYYMKQSGTLDNACGIIACIHAILNNTGDGDSKIQLAEDSTLGKFKNAVGAMSPEERAAALEGDQQFQNVHREYAAQGQSN